MSAASEVSLKQTLRKAEFPVCVKETLNKIGDILCSRTVSIKNMDLALDLIAEFIFCEVDRRGNKKPAPLGALQELQLLEILFSYFSNNSNEVSKNTVFLNLFSGSTLTTRAPVLSKLVSIAIGIPSATILLLASTWMQQTGNTPVANCSKLADTIVNDYFCLAPNSADRLRSLPDIAPPFVANFLTAVAENYYIDCKKEQQVFPPDSLLEIITYWISENSSLCIAAQQRQNILPIGVVAMEAITPIAGLLRWCVLAPLYKQSSKLYCRLHLALLNSILEIPATSPPKAICAQHLTSPVRHILVAGKQKDEDMCANRQLALDRYAQAVQIALCAGCVYGKLDDLIQQMQTLPYNRLLNIVIQTHKQKK